MDLKCTPTDYWEQWFVVDIPGGYLVQASIRENNCPQPLPKCEIQNGKNPMAYFTAISED